MCLSFTPYRWVCVYRSACLCNCSSNRKAPPAAESNQIIIIIIIWNYSNFSEGIIGNWQINRTIIGDINQSVEREQNMSVLPNFGFVNYNICPDCRNWVFLGRNYRGGFLDIYVLWEFSFFGRGGSTTTIVLGKWTLGNRKFHWEWRVVSWGMLCRHRLENDVMCGFFLFAWIFKDPS